MLWNNPCEKWSQFLTRCEEQSRLPSGKTKEAFADDVAKVYLAHGGFEKNEHNVTPMSANEANRLKAVEAAVSRAKEKDLFNMLPYILGAMSEETKLAFANQYLHPAGLRVVLAEKEEEDGFGIEAAVDTHIEIARSLEPLVNAAKNPTAVNLDLADRAAHKGMEKLSRLRRLINGAKGKYTQAKAAIGRARAKVAA
jgi:hypothetical protein